MDSKKLYNKELAVVADNLRRLRLAKGLSVSALSDFTGIKCQLLMETEMGADFAVRFFCLKWLLLKNPAVEM